MAARQRDGSKIVLKKSSNQSLLSLQIIQQPAAAFSDIEFGTKEELQSPVSHLDTGTRRETEVLEFESREEKESGSWIAG